MLQPIVLTYSCLGTQEIIGNAIRNTPNMKICCGILDCNFKSDTSTKLTAHFKAQHNNKQDVTLNITLFPESIPSTPIMAASCHPASNHNLRHETPKSNIRIHPYNSARSHISTPITPTSSRNSKYLTLSQSVMPPVSQPIFTPTPSVMQLPVSLDKAIICDDDAEIIPNSEDLLVQAGLKILELTSLQQFPTPQLLVCQSCQIGVSPKLVLPHISKHGIVFLQHAKTKLKTYVEHMNFAAPTTILSFPKPLALPFQYLGITEGYSCNLCRECKDSIGAIQIHLSRQHTIRTGTYKENCSAVSLQQYFPNTPAFSVLPHIDSLPSDNFYDLFVKQFQPSAEELDYISPPLSDNEINPLLKVTQWHEHLAKFITSKSKTASLLQLMKLPTSATGNGNYGKPLATIINDYLKDIRMHANNAALGIKCLLMECPRYGIL